MSIFSNFFKKEAPLLGLQGSGGGLGFLAGGAASGAFPTAYQNLINNYSANGFNTMILCMVR